MKTYYGRSGITRVVARRLRVCSREAIGGEKKREPPKVTVARWATIAIGIACSRNILTRESPPLDPSDTSPRYESIIHRIISPTVCTEAGGRSRRRFESRNREIAKRWRGNEKETKRRWRIDVTTRDRVRKDFLTGIESPPSRWQYKIESRSIA